MKNIFAFPMIVLLSLPATGPALAATEENAGQLVIPSPVADDPPVGQMTLPGTELPELPGLPGLPESPSTEYQGDTEYQDNQGTTQFDHESILQPEPIASGEAYPLEPEAECNECGLFDLEPALLESTGTWLRRGFWYTEVDAVILNMEFAKQKLVLMHQFTGIRQATDDFGRIVSIPIGNSLLIYADEPNVETMPRIKVGRFLFRDSSNRDHTAEFTWFGGGQWSQTGSLEAVPEGTELESTSLSVLESVDHGNPSFEGASSSQYEYGNRFNSFELNYHLKRRLHRDQMILRPDGEWVRAATPTLTRTFLTGLRYFQMDDLLNWDAQGIPDNVTGEGATVDGNYHVRTENDLYGMQTGASLNYETSRWSLGILGKTGVYLNRMFLDSSFHNTTELTSGRTSSSDDAVSFLSEVRIQGKWHLRPNFSFRSGLELMYIKSLAFAPYQLNFVPGDYSPIDSAAGNRDHYAFYLGFSAGFEGYW